MKKIILISLMALLIAGCSWYGAKDSVTQGAGKDRTIVTKQSSSVGIGKTVVPPAHTASSIDGAQTIVGATEWEDVSSNTGLYLLYWFGGIAILAGIAGGVLFKRYFLGASVAAAGLLLILVAQYVWILLIVAALGLTAGVWFVLDARSRAKVMDALSLNTKAMKQTVDGVQDLKVGLTRDERDTINTTIAGKQNDDVQELVRVMKNKGMY